MAVKDRWRHRKKVASGGKAPAPAGPKRTLDRALSRLGVASRTDAARLIDAGRVRVNGHVATDPERWVDVRTDVLSIDGEKLEQEKAIHLLLYKPKGVIVTRRDPKGRKTVYDLLPPELADRYIFPVGRLDLDSSGLLVMTNDSKLADHLTSPDTHVPKTYLVRAATLLTDAQLDQLRTGVTLADGPTRPAVVERIRDAGPRAILEITLTEGRNRQVRRMLEAVGSKVLKLVRVAIGPLRPGDLPVGACRELTKQEVAALLRKPRRSDAGK